MEANSNVETPRSEWIDLVRVFAIFLVVLCHAIEEGIYDFNLDSMAGLSRISKLFGIGLFTITRLGSCLFLIMSGYLLLDRVYDKEKILRFWKKSWLHLLFCTIIWFLIYDLFLLVYYGRKTPLITIFYDLIFFHKVDMMNVWYMPVILGIYVLIPFVAIALQQIDTRMLKFPFLFYLFFSFGFPLVRTINTILGGPDMSLQLSTGFSGGVYCIYIICGYLVKKGVFKPVKSIWLMIIIVCSVVSGTLLQLWAFSKGVRFIIWYNNPLILTASLALFELFSRIREIKHAKFLKQLASYSFAVYLIHVIIRELLVRYFSSWPISRPIRVFIFWIVTLVLSYIVSWLISKIPKVGNYILYRK